MKRMNAVKNKSYNECLEVDTGVATNLMRGIRKDRVEKKREDERAARQEREARRKAGLPENAGREAHAAIHGRDFVF